MCYRRCAIWTVDKGILQGYLDESCTFKEIIEKLGMKMVSSQGMHYKRLKNRIQEDGLDLTKFRENNKKYLHQFRHNLILKRELSDETCFIQNSRTNRCTIKRKILRKNLIEYKCHMCGMLPTWNQKELSLELDHINSINDDNRLENLRFLCPNCHSQVTNEHQKKLRKHRDRIRPKNLCACGNSKYVMSVTCKNCRTTNIAKTHFRKFNPTKEQLEEQINLLKGNMRAIGRYYNVSDNSIRKRCKLLGINYKRNRPGQTRTDTPKHVTFCISH